MVELRAHSVFDPYHEDLTISSLFIVSFPLTSFAHVPSNFLHQFSIVLQTFIVASLPSSFEPKIPMTEMAINHQCSYPPVVASF